MASRGAARRKNAITEAFAARPIAMLESPAFRVLSRAAHQVLARMEIEYSHHGGHDNGALPVTYDDLVKYGLHRHAIAPALRELEELGFIELMRHGCALNADMRQPSLYRITYRHAEGADGDGTHEWRNIAPIEDAEAKAEKARLEVNPRSRQLALARVRKNKTPVTVSAIHQ